MRQEYKVLPSASAIGSHSLKASDYIITRDLLYKNARPTLASDCHSRCSELLMLTTTGNFEKII